MPFVESVRGVNIYYEGIGDGPPLVFLHGWSMSGRVWRFQAEELASAYRVITLDLRGHGLSAVSGEAIAMEDFARDVTALFDRLDLTHATLIGWSMGVQVALAAYHAVRSRLAALVLVSGTPLFTASADYPHGLPPTEAKGMGVRLKRDYHKSMGEFFRRMFAADELSREQENRIARGIVMEGKLPDPEAARRSLETLATADLRAVLASVDLPVLLIHGGSDTICLPAASRYMAERLPNARLKILEGLGHAPFLSRPAEFNAIVKEFLQGVYGRD
ncbi:MAG: pimelyl-acyl-carrier protein methyl ester [Geobacteraceae bacterium]|nr:MAG: pimelyl-acyl-carrier protein methyl ester [Geobacteraceae bacterium]